ncbi:hypothetical protein [Thiolapillus sp.]
MKHDPVYQAVEILCRKGCRALQADIDLQVLPELRALDTQQQRQVLGEIKSIMAIYKNSCGLGQ